MRLVRFFLTELELRLGCASCNDLELKDLPISEAEAEDLCRELNCEQPLDVEVVNHVLGAVRRSLKGA